MDDFVKNQLERIEIPNVNLVRGIITNRNHQVLLVKRSQNSKYYAGKWCLPGGKVDLNIHGIPSQEAMDILEYTLSKEVIEELGDEAGSMLGNSDMKFYRLAANNDNLEGSRNITWVSHVFLLEDSDISSENIELNMAESSELIWVDLNNLPSEAEFAFDQRVIVERFLREHLET
jgi:ADP-ribose pyrophosphatase YjhB (NUDIX family)